MNQLKSTLNATCAGFLLAGVLVACQPQVEVAPTTKPTTGAAATFPDFKPIAQSITLPTTVEYNDKDGTLSHLIYRSTLTYDNQNRLLFISDQEAGASANTTPWIQFHYTDNRLTSIDLYSITTNPDAPVAEESNQPARFDLTYSEQRVDARLLIAGKEVQKSTLNLDERGLPVKNNLVRLLFDEKGNLDWIANSQKFPINGTEVIDQRYDANPAVFSQVREMQLVDALLSTVNRRAPSSGLVALGSSLNTNNLVYTKRKNCDPKYGCREFDESHITTLELNQQGFPTNLICSMGAMGFYQFKVTYKQVDG